MSEQVVVKAVAVVKRYADFTAVDGVDFTIEQGQCWGLLGPNGAGKTTLLRMLIGNAPLTSGTLEVLGHSIPRQATMMRKRIGVVPQLDNLDPDFSVSENLHTYAAYFGLAGPVVEQRIEHLLDFAALTAKRAARIDTLSGGMQRRLSLIRALLNQPELLILDEPTTGLDPQARQLIWQRLRELRNAGMTLVLTTHYMEEAERLCDRVTVMDHGRFLDCAAPRDLVRKFIEPQVVEVFGNGLQAWHHRTGYSLAERSEQVGETVFYYAHDERPLLDAVGKQPELSFLHRPANLEDVFVRLTGRELRDG